jgi:hypothetical protein
MDIASKKAANNKKGMNSLFDLSHHGDEVLVWSEDGAIKLALKRQTAVGEYRATLLTFETQSQVERLLPAILKGIPK